MTDGFWRNESSDLARNILVESHALPTGEGIGSYRASSSFGKNGQADSTIDCATDAQRDDGLWSDWLHSQFDLRVYVNRKST